MTRKPTGRPTGRPYLPKSQRKDKVIKFLVTTKQQKLLEAAAKQDGREFSEWLRLITIRAALEPPIPAPPAPPPAHRYASSDLKQAIVDYYGSDPDPKE